MAVSISSLDRLKSQLLTSNIQSTNQPLYQVINQLIDFLRQSINETQAQIASLTPPSGIIPINNLIQGTPFTSDDNLSNIDTESIPIVGPIGPKGNTGLQGPPGMDGLDSECCGEPGPPGPTGARGLIGPTGLPGMDGMDGEDGISIPGPQGLRGLTGLPGINSPYFDNLEQTDSEWTPPIQNNPDTKPGQFRTTDLIEAPQFRATGAVTTPLYGAGVEIIYDNASPQGEIFSFDRTSGLFTPMRFRALQYILRIGGTGDAWRVDNSGLTNLFLGLSLGNELTPASFAVNQNNYNPTGLATAFMVRLNNTSGGTLNITGQAAPSPAVPTLKLLVKVAGSSNINLPAEDAGSTAGNRYSSSAIAFNAVLMIYEVTISRWSLISVR